MVELRTAHERTSFKPRGGSREFLGDAIEGKRADALNRATGYAFSAGIDIDTVPKENRRVMVHDEMISFLSENDFSQCITRVIYDTKDPERKVAGDGYLTRKEGDILPRAERVMIPAMGKVVIPAPEVMWEMNFDAPWHRGDAYEQILTDGMHDMLKEFFSHNPDAPIMMFVETDDLPSDGKILKNLGAIAVGREVYLNHPDPEDPDENGKDTVFILTKALFKRSLRVHGHQ